MKVYIYDRVNPNFVSLLTSRDQAESDLERSLYDAVDALNECISMGSLIGYPERFLCEKEKIVPRREV